MTLIFNTIKIIKKDHLLKKDLIMLTCEADNELLTTFYRLYLERRLDKAKDLIPEIERLSNPRTQGLL